VRWLLRPRASAAGALWCNSRRPEEGRGRKGQGVQAERGEEATRLERRTRKNRPPEKSFSPGSSLRGARIRENPTRIQSAHCLDSGFATSSATRMTSVRQTRRQFNHAFITKNYSRPPGEHSQAKRHPIHRAKVRFRPPSISGPLETFRMTDRPHPTYPPFHHLSRAAPLDCSRLANSR